MLKVLSTDELFSWLRSEVYGVKEGTEKEEELMELIEQSKSWMTKVTLLNHLFSITLERLGRSECDPRVALERVYRISEKYERDLSIVEGGEDYLRQLLRVEVDHSKGLEYSLIELEYSIQGYGKIRS